MPDRDGKLDRPPRIWMDLTTSWRARHGQSNGTLRVERSYAATLGTILGNELAFCRYEQMPRRFSALPGSFASAPVDEEARRKPQPGKGPGVRRGRDNIGRRIERAFRRSSRAMASRALGLLRTDGGRAFADARAGDVLLLAGETWGGRYDFDVLRGLKVQHGLRLAALCQDFIPIKFPQFFESREFVERYHRYADFLIREVDLLIAISKSTAADVSEYAQRHGGIRGSVEVVQLGADVAPAVTPRPPHELPSLASQSFVISVSTIQSRKNFDLLYRLWRRFAEEGRDVPTLVVVGQQGFGSNDLLWQITNDPMVRGRIAVLHGVSDAELAWLYENCRWTLYPSFYEGWGLPLSESLAYGKFCLASDTSSLPEAGEGLVRHLDPMDFPGWHAAIVELAQRPDLLAEAEARIRASYQRRTWLQSAEELAPKLRALCG